MKRVLKFKLLSQSNLEEFESEAVTFGDLKQELKSSSNHKLNSLNFDSLDSGRVELVEKITLSVYGKIDDAILPVGNRIFFVTPIESKAGIDQNEKIDNMSYNDLRSKAAYLKRCKRITHLPNKKQELIDIIKNYIKENGTDTETNTEANTDNVIEILNNAKHLIDNAITIFEKTKKYATGDTYEELNMISEKLKRLLNT